MAHAVARRIPPEMEEKLGESAFAQITIDRRLIQDPEIQAQLKELVAPLVEVLPEDRFLFKFHIVEDSSLNAFAMPGGFVVLHSGLLLKSDRAEEVLGVLAHEIAHVTRQHTLRNIIESASLYLIVQTFFGDLSGLAAVLADSGAFILQQKFSRTFEEEADKEGLRYLVQARIDPTGFIDFFHKIKEEQDRTILGKATSNLTWLSTHPATEGRILNLKKRIDNLQLQEELPSLKIHYKKFQADLRRHLQE